MPAADSNYFQAHMSIDHPRTFSKSFQEMQAGAIQITNARQAARQRCATSHHEDM
jgi:hypothetical protein